MCSSQPGPQLHTSVTTTIITDGQKRSENLSKFLLYVQRVVTHF